MENRLQIAEKLFLQNTICRKVKRRHLLYKMRYK